MSIRHLFISLYLITGVASLSGFAQTSAFWNAVPESMRPDRREETVTPDKFVTFRLDTRLLSSFLKDIPTESEAAAGRKVPILPVPMPDGSIQRFRVELTEVLSPALAKDHPDWKTFRGTGIDDPLARAQFDWNILGFHGYVSTPTGTVYIEPYERGNTSMYMVFYKHEFGSSTVDFSCKTEMRVARLADHLMVTANSLPRPEISRGTAVRTYRMAVATTGEWARNAAGFNGTQTPVQIRTAALAVITTSVNRLNGIFERELASRFQLVNPSVANDATNIIFDDPTTDPYDNSDNTAQLNINQSTVTNRVGTANFDVGHLYGTGGGGVASAPSLCSDTAKAEGYSARGTNTGDPFVVDYVAHEVGHQFGANHTYNNADPGGACTTRSATSAYEVASGSTLLSYVGICNQRNLQQYVDGGFPSFHIVSLTEIHNNLTTGDPQTTNCGVAAGVNRVPTVNAGASFTIPRLTPFTLTAVGGDADADDVRNLLFSWEQYDLAPSASGASGIPANTYDTDTDGVLRPLFRAYSPVTTPDRTFPSLNFILNPAANDPAGSNQPPLHFTGAHPTAAPGAVCEAGVTCVIGERLPSVARTMNFRVSTRDRRGGLAEAGTTVIVAGNAGPFRVTAQDTAQTWASGSTQTVTWDVAGSNLPPVNAASVNILLSIDGGQTFPVTLLAGTPNDGTEEITVPAMATTQARIKIAAANNIFFDINNVNFQITAPQPGLAVGNGSGSEASGPSLAPESASVDFLLTLSGPNPQAITVKVSTTGITATEGVDFAGVDDFAVVFPPNVTQMTVAVPLLDDGADEPDETFALDVIDSPDATVADGQGIGTIIDNDLTPTAAEADVAGRVLTADGHGVRNASVIITDQDGKARTVITNSFGYYRFSAVEIGRTYVLTVGTRRSVFRPRVITVGDSMIDVDLVGQ